MKTYLVTGAAGFIGANYIKYILAKHNDIKVVILDALTYAGNLGTIAKDIDNERCVFIKGDICSRDVVDGLFAEYRFDYVGQDHERKPMPSWFMGKEAWRRWNEYSDEAKWHARDWAREKKLVNPVKTNTYEAV